MDVMHITENHRRVSLMPKRPEQHQIENQYPIINIFIKWQKLDASCLHPSKKRSKEDHYSVAIEKYFSVFEDHQIMNFILITL
jgi:hypothetical protein